MVAFLQVPTYTIAQNAGVEGAVVVGKLLEQDNPNWGYDAAKGEASTLGLNLENTLSGLSCFWRPFLFVDGGCAACFVVGWSPY